MTKPPSNRGTLPFGIGRMVTGVFGGGDKTEPVSKPPRSFDRDVEPPDPAKLAEAAEPSQSPRRRSRDRHTGDVAGFTPGAVFRGHIIGKKFAEGGLSLLYEGTPLSGGESAPARLIKVLKPYFLAPKYKQIQDKLEAEGKLLQNVRRPFLVEAFDSGVDERVGPFVIMEKLDGKSLFEVIRAQRAQRVQFDPVQVATLGAKLATHLHSMHRIGAVHRDVKPANIFMAKVAPGESEPKLIDWGAAKSEYTAETSLGDDYTIGTAAYMAPEQVVHEAVWGAADLYALAIILIEMLWRNPFLQEGVDGRGLAARQLVSLAAEPPSYRVPRGLWAIFKLSLEKDPNERHPSCEAFAEALRAWLDSPDACTPEPAELVVEVRSTAPSANASPRLGREPALPGLEVLQQPPRIALDAVCGRPTLVIKSGLSAGARFELGARHIIGRDARFAHILIADEGISNRHAALEGVVLDPRAPIYTVVDLGSLNGTRISGVPLGGESKPVLSQLASVEAGQIIELDMVEMSIMPAGRLGPETITTPGGPKKRWQTVAEAKAWDEIHKPSSVNAIGEQPVAAAGTVYTEPAASMTPVAAVEPALAAIESPPVEVVAPPSLRRQRDQLALGARCDCATLLIQFEDQQIRVLPEAAGVIGRRADTANIVVDQGAVSASHVRYERTADKRGIVTYTFYDLESRNGTLVERDGDLVRVRGCVLQPGAEMMLGRDVKVRLLPPGFIRRQQIISVDATGRASATGVYIGESVLNAPLWLRALVVATVLTVAVVLAGGAHFYTKLGPEAFWQLMRGGQ